MSRMIRLKRDTEMSTPYQGRGIVSTSCVFAAGTPARYSRMLLNDDITVVHTATVQHEGKTFIKVIRTIKTD